jgi:hypothetical protein
MESLGIWEFELNYDSGFEIKPSFGLIVGKFE